MNSDILYSYIIPKNPGRWLFVSKSSNIIAEKYLLSDPDFSILLSEIFVGYLLSTKRDKLFTIISNSNRFNEIIFTNLNFKFAIDSQNIDIVAKFLANPKILPAYGENYALRTAATKGNEKIVEMLLKREEVDPRDCNYRAVRAAVYYGHLSITKMFLNDSRVDFSNQRNRIFSSAIDGDYPEIIQLLIASDRIPVYSCLDVEDLIRNGHLSIAKNIITSPKFTAGIYSHALSIACAYGDVEIVKLLIAHPQIIPNESDIIAAAENNQIEIMKLLLNNPRFNDQKFLSKIGKGLLTHGHFDLYKELLKNEK